MRVQIALCVWIFASHFSFAQERIVPNWCKELPRPAYKDLQKIETPESWFGVYAVKPGVFAIYEGKQYEEVISYLILGNERALLFDTGMGIGSIRRVVSDLTSLPVIVINSHTHPDHIGGNSEFSDVRGLDLPFTKTNSAGYSDPEMRKWVGPDQLCSDLPKGFLPEEYRIAPFKIVRLIRNHEIIDLGERTMEILLTPGHTPDSLMLLDRKNRLLFTGDTFYPGPIYLYSPDTDFAAYVASVTAIQGLKNEVDYLLPAHNAPLATPEFLQRLAAALQDISAGKASARPWDSFKEYSFNGFSIILP